MTRPLHLLVLAAFVALLVGSAGSGAAWAEGTDTGGGTVIDGEVKDCVVTVTITGASIVTNGPNGPVLQVEYKVDGTMPSVSVQSILITYQSRVETTTVTGGQKPTVTTSTGTVLAVASVDINNSFNAGDGLHGTGEASANYNAAAVEQGRKSLHSTTEANGTTVVTNPVGPLVVSITVVGVDGTPCSGSATKSFEYQKLRMVKK